MATKLEKFNVILGVLNGTEGVDAEVVEMVEKEIARLETRSGSERKLTKTQEENIGVKVEILAFLAGEDEGATATDVGEAVDIKVQKASALLRQLVAEGAVARVEGKGKEKTRFVATEVVTD